MFFTSVLPRRPLAVKRFHSFALLGLPLLIAIPLFLIVDSLVVLLTLRLLQIPHYWEIFKKSIRKVWLFGLAAKLLGSLLWIGAGSIRHSWWTEWIAVPLLNNPFDNGWSLGFALLTLLLIALLLFLCNRKISFKKTSLVPNAQRAVALALALLTTPYLLLLPKANTAFFTNHIVSDAQNSVMIVNTKTTQRILPSEEIAALLSNAVNDAQPYRRTTTFESGEYQLDFFERRQTEPSAAHVSLWIEADHAIFVLHQGNLYRVRHHADEVAAAFLDLYP